MKAFASFTLILFIVLGICAPFALLPKQASALTAWVPGQPLVPCETSQYNAGQSAYTCSFGDVIQLIQNLIDLMFYLSVPLVAITLAYAGYEYLTAMGNTGQVAKARKMFTSVGLGFVFMLSAWLVVKFIEDNVLSSDFKQTLPVDLNQ
jgi:Type IV secretion system pilin